jgi:hypothetical protein
MREADNSGIRSVVAATPIPASGAIIGTQLHHSKGQSRAGVAVGMEIGTNHRIYIRSGRVGRTRRKQGRAAQQQGAEFVFHRWSFLSFPPKISKIGQKHDKFGHKNHHTSLWHALCNFSVKVSSFI